MGLGRYRRTTELSVVFVTALGVEGLLRRAAEAVGCWGGRLSSVRSPVRLRTLSLRAREATPPLSARTPRSAGESKAGDEAPFPAIASLEDEERKLQTVAFDEEERKLRDDAAEMRSAVSSLEAWREERRVRGE